MANHVQTFNGVDCILCGYPLAVKGTSSSTSQVCKPCEDEYIANEQAREESYRQAREKRVAYQQAEHEKWRVARYEQRCQELEEQRKRVDEYRETQLQKGLR